MQLISWCDRYWGPVEFCQLPGAFKLRLPFVAPMDHWLGEGLLRGCFGCSVCCAFWEAGHCGALKLHLPLVAPMDHGRVRLQVVPAGAVRLSPGLHLAGHTEPLHARSYGLPLAYQCTVSLCFQVTSDQSPLPPCRRAVPLYRPG